MAEAKKYAVRWESPEVVKDGEFEAPQVELVVTVEASDAEAALQIAKDTAAKRIEGLELFSVSPFRGGGPGRWRRGAAAPNP